MKINGRNGESQSSESHAEQDDMLETENEAVRERVSDLEKKVSEQGDEIVCLRSTLADVLRRLSQLEGSRPATTPLKSPLRGTIYNFASSQTLSNGSTPIGKEGFRYRPDSKDNVRRAHSYAPSSLPQRRGVHYQSTGSLQSDTPSSSSVSPPPASPTPIARTQDTLSKLPSPSSNLHTAKRWSSTGDFNHMSSPVHNSRLAAKSLFNLHMRPNSSPNHAPLLKHGEGSGCGRRKDEIIPGHSV